MSEKTPEKIYAGHDLSSGVRFWSTRPFADLVEYIRIDKFDAETKLRRTAYSLLQDKFETLESALTESRQEVERLRKAIEMAFRKTDPVDAKFATRLDAIRAILLPIMLQPSEGEKT